MMKPIDYSETNSHNFLAALLILTGRVRTAAANERYFACLIAEVFISAENIDVADLIAY